MNIHILKSRLINFHVFLNTRIKYLSLYLFKNAPRNVVDDIDLNGAE